MPSLRLRRTLLAAGLTLAGAGLFSCSDRSEPTAPADAPALARTGVPGPDLRAALAAKAKYDDLLLAKAGVVGTAVGLRADGQAVLKVYLARPGATALAASLDGVAVESEVTGEIRAELPTATPTVGAAVVNPKTRFARPVPIGVSAGNLNDLVYFKTFCTTGTMGARLKGANGKFFALSNNHVFAVENRGQAGDPIVQPGQADHNCQSTVADRIGNLGKFIPLKFATTATNLVDAALATVTATTVGNTTPSNGYGKPSVTTKAAALNQRVQKYGRTTVLTHGTVTGLNATVKVGYEGGKTAIFLHQIIISNRTATSFSGPGDSGSLIVTDDAGKNPVGLLFAGSTTVTVANPIATVLSQLGAKVGTTLTIQ
jgi:hypothetical protein